MQLPHFSVTQADQSVTNLYYSYTDAEHVSGSVLILHGMAEYHVRYIDFARFLNAAGFDVYLYDHRGHGTTCPEDKLGYFDDKDGYDLVVNDAVHLCHYIKENGRSEKLVVFGHSMGSLILRNVLQRYDEMDCAVVCATTMPSSAVASAGLAIANLMCTFSSPRKRSPFLNNLMFGNNKYKSLCTRTDFDWLTRDESIVDWYIESPYCGFICTTSMYRDLLKLAKNAGNKKQINQTRKNLPIYFIAGTKDPVGGYASEINNLVEIYKNLEFKDISVTLYPEARHELLNETCKEEIMNDVLSFIQSKLA